MIESKNRLYDIVANLCADNNESFAEMCKKTGLRPGLFSDLKSKKEASLSMESLKTIADHFNISMDVLFERNVQETG